MLLVLVTNAYHGCVRAMGHVWVGRNRGASGVVSRPLLNPSHTHPPQTQNNRSSDFETPIKELAAQHFPQRPYPSALPPVRVRKQDHHQQQQQQRPSPPPNLGSACCWWWWEDCGRQGGGGGGGDAHRPCAAGKRVHDRRHAGPGGTGARGEEQQREGRGLSGGG